MKKRGGKREGAGQKKSPALAKLIKSIGVQITIVQYLESLRFFDLAGKFVREPS